MKEAFDLLRQQIMAAEQRGEPIANTVREIQEVSGLSLENSLRLLNLFALSPFTVVGRIVKTPHRIWSNGGKP